MKIRNLLNYPTLCVLGLITTFLLSPAVIAQDTPVDVVDEEEFLEEVIVTGSIIRRPETATASPVSVLSEQELDIRGLNTMADAITMLPANNAGTMNASWSSFGFATGASAVSLRGLTTSASLTIFDGMRMAPYPLGDDGRRNFVDLGTIPDSIVERVEILKDGASATYGADAIAGVVNVITKKEIIGTHIGTSYGISEDGEGEEYRGDFTWGTGELDSDGYNFYMALELQHNESVPFSSGPSKYNNWDDSDKCNAEGVCMDNNARNGLQYDGTIYGVSGNGVSVPMVRPWDPVAGGALGDWRLLNPQAGCRDLVEVNPTNAADVGLDGPVCQEDRSAYVNIYPRIARQGLSMRFTKRFGDAEAYAMLNYYKVETDQSGGTPWGFHGTTTPGGPEIVRVGITPVLLPVYVCPLGPNGVADVCDATNGTLNPNNPYAAQGQMARLSYTPGNYTGGREANIETESLRYAFGIQGSFGEWDYSLDAIFARIDLEQTRTGYPKPRRLLNVIADGSLNLVDPSQNSQAMWDYMYPSVTNNNTSDVDQIQATIARPIFEMSGGSVMAALGVSWREESVRAPSANGFQTDPYERYLSVNTVAATGSRHVESAFFEIDAPVTVRPERFLTKSRDSVPAT
jgi:iron complex outermembrane receptor protein